MAERKSFLLRVDRDTLDAVQRWAIDDMRSLNGQIEFLLRRALQQARRVPRRAELPPTVVDTTEPDSESNSDPE